MKTINRLRVLNKLKSVYRSNTVDERKESSAEHTWCCLMLADHFMPKDLDRLRVFELLMYHDLVEIDAGDTPLHPAVDRTHKTQREKVALKTLSRRLPEPLKSNFVKNFEEFEAQKSLESRFAKAIDALEAQIHELDYKKDWQGWSRNFLVEKKAHLFNDFPALAKVFDKLLDYLENEGYFKC